MSETSWLSNPTAWSKAFEGAKNNRLNADWDPVDYDPEIAWEGSGQTLGARGADLARNSPYFAAILNAFILGVVGPEGLRFSSAFRMPAGQAADSQEGDNARLEYEEEQARAIDRAVKYYTRGTSLDAAGRLTLRDMQVRCLASEAVYGDVFLQRLKLPNRPGRHTHATCWRMLHPTRCQTPPEFADSDKVRNGIRYDKDGAPIGAYFRTRHPQQDQTGSTPQYVRIPFYDERGMPILLWKAAGDMPEQQRGIGWVAPCMKLIKQITGVTDAHVIAKRIQASMGLIIAVQNPRKAASSDANGEVLNPNTKIQPGKTYYVKAGTTVSPLNFSYQGSDFDQFTNQLLQAICAGFGPGIPWQFAMQQLTKSNMASSRAALMQAWRAFRGEQTGLIGHILQPMIDCGLDEDLSRGRLVMPDEMILEDYTVGKWRRPSRLSTDDYRDMQASKVAVEIGASPESALENHDYDYTEEREQAKRNRDLNRRLGLSEPESTAADDPEGDAAAAQEGNTDDE